MKTLVVTKDVAQMIRGHANLPFRETGYQLPNGDWEIPVDDEVYARLDALRFEGETFSDTIVRAFAAMDGKLNN